MVGPQTLHNKLQALLQSNQHLHSSHSSELISMGGADPNKQNEMS